MSTSKDNLEDKIWDLKEAAEFYEHLADKRKKQLHIAMNFIQYILDQWEIDTHEAQEKAIEFVKKIHEIKIK